MKHKNDTTTLTKGSKITIGMTLGTVVIRDARADDAAALADLLTQLGFPATEAEAAARLEALTAAGETVLVAALDDRPVGLVTIHITPVLHRPTAVGRMTALVVDHSLRGTGVGRLLVEAAERHVASRGCALMEVTSNLKLAEAHGFYERLGYEHTSKRFKKPLSS